MTIIALGVGTESGLKDNLKLLRNVFIYKQVKKVSIPLYSRVVVVLSHSYVRCTPFHFESFCMDRIGSTHLKEI